jgi:hypothetical protein
VGGLFDYTAHRLIGNEVRIILKARGVTDLSVDVCKQWVRDFIQDIVPEWPERALTDHEEKQIGHEFQNLLAAAQGESVDDD